jgi:type III restriction enzyme
MELKSYQQRVIREYGEYIQDYLQTGDPAAAFTRYWKVRGMIPERIVLYNDAIPHVPHVCFKVPTGGGKTLLACHAVKPVFDIFPEISRKLVVWLVPSDTILEQTAKNLKDVHHPYRQKLDAAFNGRVEVLEKEEVLNGQNFNPVTVVGQLTVLVLSFDSLRAKETTKEWRKMYQENGALAVFPPYPEGCGTKVSGADESSLIQIINGFRPMVIIDESHHAVSELSVDVLNSLNPLFILDLTATPHRNSNVISYVTAAELKKEHMIKLPVILYNRVNQEEVLSSAIDLRRQLEDAAAEETKKTQVYIRPIVLFQAETKSRDSNTTYVKLKARLVEFGIPEEQIAIKTADINELKGIDLKDPTCPVRFIITVNALKEGWDCPFAYILASLANRNSTVDVEQILGRTLRLPYTREYANPVLNLSYVFTSSTDFSGTISKVIQGLQGAGFTEKDYRLAEPEQAGQGSALPQGDTVKQQEIGFDEALNASPDAVKELLKSKAEGKAAGSTVWILEEAKRQNEEYRKTEEIYGEKCDPCIPPELANAMNQIMLSNVMEEELKNFAIPQFCIKEKRPNFFDSTRLFTPECLTEGFSLRNRDSRLDIESIEDQIAQIDIDEQNTIKQQGLQILNPEEFKKMVQNMPGEHRKAYAKGIIFDSLERLDCESSSDIRDYVEQILKFMTEDQLDALELNPYLYASRIKNKIVQLRTAYIREEFRKQVDAGNILCEPLYRFPRSMSATHSPDRSYVNTLYNGIDNDLNAFEKNFVWKIQNLPNIVWWHRNPSRGAGFCINGPVSMYPDFLVMTKSGTLLAVETKGDQLQNSESLEKLKLGKLWEAKAGSGTFRYFMVFQKKDTGQDGAYTEDSFIELLKMMK